MLTLIALTVPLCIDSFLMAAAIGLTRPSRRQKLRLSALFATFEAGTPLVGLIAGRSLSGTLGHYAQYAAIAILVGFGLYLFFNPSEDDKAQRLTGAKGLAVLALGLSISLDGLAIGFTYGLLKLSVFWVTLLIVIQAFVLSHLGFAVGGSLPAKLRAMGEKLASLALVAIGVFLAVKEVF